MNTLRYVKALLLAGSLMPPAACLTRARRDDKPVLAQVAGTPIYVDDFKKQLGRLKLEADDAGAPPEPSVVAQKRALLDDLVNRRLLLQEAEKRNVTVPSDEVDVAYQKVRAGWKDDDFAALLKEKDLTPGEMKNEVREMLLVRKYLRDYVFARVAVTDAEIEAYVKEHPEALVIPETVHARQILVKTEDQANSVLAEIKGGKSFEDAAIKHSLSPDGQSGGDLGFFARGVMPKVFDDTCFDLRAGELSRVVSSPYGFHLFKVLERHPAGERTLAQVRDTVETRLRRDKEHAAQADKLRELHAAANVVIKEDRLAQIL